MTSASTGWRTVRGACDAQGALVERTVDGGATWASVPLAQPTSEILQLVGSSNDLARVSIASLDAASCELIVNRSFSAGGGWQIDTDLPSFATYLSDDGSLLVQGRPFTSPCASPLALELGTSTVAVNCEDGLYMAPLAGAWTATDVEPPATLVALDDSFLVGYVGRDAACEGVTVQRFAADFAGELGSQCVPIDAEAGAIAISAFGGQLWVWAGDSVVSAPLEV